MLKKYKDFRKIKINENENTIQGLEYDLSFFKYAYRWIGQPGLFQYFYGDHKDMRDYVLNDKKDINLNRIDIMETSYKGGIPMTVDPGYIGEPLNGETIIRLVFDVQKLIKDFKIQNLLTNGEAEFRVMENIKDFTKYLVRIDLNDDAYHNTYEDEFADYSAIENYFPHDVDVELEFFDETEIEDDAELFSPRISNVMKTEEGKEELKELRKEGKI